MDSDNEETFSIKSEKKSTLESYFYEQEKYTKMYGDKTIVFFQLGKFYDAYCTKTKGYLMLEELEALLNVKYIRREEKSRENPYNKPNQFGINCVSIKSKLAKLIENGYTIVIFDQTTDGKKIERVCTGVYSPGTYVSDQRNDTNIMSVYIAEEKQMVGKNLMAIGVTIIDVATGNSIIHEFYSDKNDEIFGLDELIRVMKIFNPTEIIIYYHPIELNENVIKNIKLYLELDRQRNVFFYVYFNKKGDDKMNLMNEEIFKINYQNNYLSKIFDLNSQKNLYKMTSPIEILKLERKTYTIISLIIILKYIAEHNVLLLKNLAHPEIYIYNSHLILGNNAIEQLNILNSNNLESYNKKINSLFDVINKTSTPIGRRYLKANLSSPMSQENKKEIIKRYNIIEELSKNKFYLEIREHLKKIHDVEKLHRKMAMGTITPHEFSRLDVYYKEITKIVLCIKKKKVLKDLILEETSKNFLSYQTEYHKEYELESMQQCHNLNDIDESFFKKGIHEKIDNLQDKLDYTNSVIDSIKNYLTNLIVSRSNNKDLKDTNIIKKETNERDGLHFTITKSNEPVLKNAIKSISGKIKISLSIGEIMEIEKSDIIFKSLKKGRTKIFIKSILKHTTKLSEYIEKLTKSAKKLFIKSMTNYFQKYKSMFHKICNFIAIIDFCVSGAIVANENYYCKPVISSEKNVPSYLKVKGLRHPIIEKLYSEVEYVPNDIEMGNIPIKDTEIGKNGILLYGLNSAGKSSYMKSIGIAVIMAQMGYYVPAEFFEYEPYMALYARITGNDNMLKGLSSFGLEMTELDAILLRTEKQGVHTIVIGDEVCRGTEDISGVSIVASALVSLSECNSTFIFSSHLHELPNITEVKNLKNLRLFHLKVEYDDQKNCLVFDRKLTTGSGPRIYGLTVAKYLIKNKKFLNRAEIIKNRIMKENYYDVPTKKSNYNSQIYVKSCYICGHIPSSEHHKELECHHINFQKNCLENGKIKIKPYLDKNELYNLVILCNNCHKQVHNGTINIFGYLDTSTGPLLNYKINIKKKLSTLDVFERVTKPSPIR